MSNEKSFGKPWDWEVFHMHTAITDWHCERIVSVPRYFLALPEISVRFTSLYADYKAWCERNERPAGNEEALSDRLLAFGYKEDGTRFTGLRFCNPGELERFAQMVLSRLPRPSRNELEDYKRIAEIASEANRDDPSSDAKAKKCEECGVSRDSVTYLLIWTTECVDGRDTEFERARWFCPDCAASLHIKLKDALDRLQGEIFAGESGLTRRKIQP